MFRSHDCMHTRPAGSKVRPKHKFCGISSQGFPEFLFSPWERSNSSSRATRTGNCVNYCDSIMSAIIPHDAIATVCSSRGGHFLGQTHLRISCPSFICVKSKRKM